MEIFPQQKDFAIRTFGLPGGAGFLGVCFGTVVTRELVVELEPSVDQGIVRTVNHRSVVGVTHGDQTAGSQHPLSLDESSDRITEVLQHLVCVHDVELGVAERQVVDVCLDEPC